MKPRTSWRTWHEQERDASGVPLYRVVLEVISTILMGLALFVALAIGILVALVFVSGVWAEPLLRLLMTPPLPALIGIVIVVSAGWGLARVFIHRSDPSITRRTRIVGSVSLVILGLFGVLITTIAVATPPTPNGF